jgi:hypothetical protein
MSTSSPDVAAYSLVSGSAGAAASYISGQINVAANVGDAALNAFKSAVAALQIANDQSGMLGSITGIRVRRLNSSIASKLNQQVSWPVLSSSTLSSIPKPTTLTLDSLPSFSTLVSGIDSARSQLLARLSALLAAGSTGLSTAVEQAIWDRARQRQELKNLAQYAEAENYFAARGFDLPTGALVGRLTQIGIEIGRNEDALNMDIAIEQAKLEQTNIHFILDKGVTIVVEMMNSAINAVLKANETKLDAFKQNVLKYTSELDAAVKLMELSVKEAEAKTDLIKAKVTAASADADADAKSLAVEAEIAKAEAMLSLERAKAIVEYNIRKQSIQVEAAKGVAQAAAQVCAGALAAVNMSVHYGYTASASAIGQGTNSWSSSTSVSTINQTTASV